MIAENRDTQKVVNDGLEETEAGLKESFSEAKEAIEENLVKAENDPEVPKEEHPKKISDTESEDFEELSQESVEEEYPELEASEEKFPEDEEEDKRDPRDDQWELTPEQKWGFKKDTIPKFLDDIPIFCGNLFDAWWESKGFVSIFTEIRNCTAFVIRWTKWHTAPGADISSQKEIFAEATNKIDSHDPQNVC